MPTVIATARQAVEGLYAAALEAVDPRAAVRRVLLMEGDRLRVDGTGIEAPRGVHVVAVGKAAVAMTHGALEALDGAVAGGIVITKEGHVDSALPATIAVHEAGHPIPDERGLRATEDALAMVAGLTAGDVALALISGGGSALLEAPRPGITLADLATTTDLLLRAGAPIDALNAVRAPLSRVKAGGLRAAAPEATWVTLILSDVLGNDPRVIASGPTVRAAVDPERALALLDAYGIRQRVPSAVRSVLEGLSPPANRGGGDRDVVRIIADNATAVAAAARHARDMGYDVRVIWRDMQGEAANLGRAFVAEAAGAPEEVGVLLGGGEATVTVRGDGVGGRNTEFALAAALELDRRGMRGWAIASLATDGQDANTGLAGAVADAWTCQRARERGVDPAAALARNDSAAVFAAAGGAVAPGPTGTNVNDLYIAVRVRGDATDGDGGD